MQKCFSTSEQEILSTKVLTLLSHICKPVMWSFSVLFFDNQNNNRTRLDLYESGEIKYVFWASINFV